MTKPTAHPNMHVHKHDHDGQGPHEHVHTHPYDLHRRPNPDHKAHQHAATDAFSPEEPFIKI